MPEISNSIVTLIDSPDSTPLELLTTRGHNRLWVAVRHGRKFLYKGLAPEYAGKPEYRALLRKEFELGMKLDHPGIVRVWGMEETPFGPCLVMDYIDGITLAEFMAEKTALSERRRVALEIAESLAYAHAKGVSHRDLKPDNVLITRTGQQAKLIDFGLGDSDDYAILKASGATRSFGAPEQNADCVGDSRSDVYAFGKMLKYLETGNSKLIRKCLSAKPEERPAMRQCVATLRRADSFKKNVLIMTFSLIPIAATAFILFWPKNEPAAVKELTPEVINQPAQAVPEDSPKVMAQAGKMWESFGKAAPGNAVTTPAQPAKTAAPPDMKKVEAEFEAMLAKTIEAEKPYWLKAFDTGSDDYFPEAVTNILTNNWKAFHDKWFAAGVSAEVIYKYAQKYSERNTKAWKEYVQTLYEKKQSDNVEEKE